ncbi:MAG: nitroreductase family protein [Victivallaceae bacterium]|nr:nitroreductase family protein [Victivallaceae bacterium]
MEFFDVLRARRSVRSFQDRAIPDDSFRRIVDAVVCAPSACNRQPYRFLWVRSPELRRKLKTTTLQPTILDAPVVVAGCVDRTAAWRLNAADDRSIGEVDLAIAVEHLVLAAAAESLGSCWVGAFDTKRAAESLGVEEPWRVDFLLPIGFPAGNVSPFTRGVPAEEMMKVL